jgi:hypothetical protein
VLPDFLKCVCNPFFKAGDEMVHGKEASQSLLILVVLRDELENVPDPIHHNFLHSADFFVFGRI